MVTSSSGMRGISLTPSGASGFYDKLNAQWHKRSLQLFMVVVLAHWAEHLTQAVQIYALGWPRPAAGGVLGLWFPWMVSSEALHYAYAIVMLAGLWVLRKGFTGLSLKWWTAALVIQFWHHLEHALLQAQVLFDYNLLGSPVPLSFLQIAFPTSRVEIHLFYNAVVFLPMVVGMYYHLFPPANEAARASCTCALAREHVGVAA
jgi:hypothetical protein